MLEVVEYTDPACAWAWGSEPAFRLLRSRFRVGLSWRRVFAILFDEDDAPAPDAEAERRHYERWLADVSNTTGAPYPERLERVPRSSVPASLVAKAAERQGARVGDRVLRRLREAMFVDGVPPDDLERALHVAAEVPGVDVARLREDAGSAAVAAAVAADRAEARRPDPAVDRALANGPHPGRPKTLDTGRRYALPTLHLRGPNGNRWLPGWRSPADYVAAARGLAPDLAVHDGPLTGSELVEEMGSVTAAELRLLTGDERPPRGVTRVATRGGGVWRL